MMSNYLTTKNKEYIQLIHTWGQTFSADVKKLDQTNKNVRIHLNEWFTWWSNYFDKQNPCQTLPIFVK